MNASFLKKTLLLLSALLLCATTLASCKTTLKPGDNGLYDNQNKITYCHASTVYEATKLVKEYGKLALTQKESYDLYTIPGTDPTEMLATEDFNIVYAAGITMPTLLEMAPSVIHVCTDGTETVHEIQRIEDTVAVASIVTEFTAGENLPYPAGSPLRSYKVRFESVQYPGFYYTLTYVEYASDVEIDGENHGRFFLRSAFEGIFIPVGDEIHKALGYTD